MNPPPARCPNTTCSNHRSPTVGFYVNNGEYHPRCRSNPVRRFRCKSCRKSFSNQTFRVDYRDHLPHQNRAVFKLLVGGMSLRQVGRTLGIHNATVQRKAFKIARAMAQLHGNLLHALPNARAYLLDEEETYEQKSIRTLTIPILIEKDSWFIVATDVAPIRRLARKGTVRRRRQDAEERKHGKRPDESRAAVANVLRTLARVSAGQKIELITDQKSSYATVAKRVLAEGLSHHQRVSSRLPRNQYNPLFAINTTNAMTRDHLARLRRRSWCVSKKRDRLHAHLALFTAYRNYVRPRFNTDEEQQTPANRLGLLPRNLTIEELLRWRQDWGDLSSHPMSTSGSRPIRATTAALSS